MNMDELLANVGFEVQAETLNDYTLPSQIEFPFGSCTSNVDQEVHYESTQESLRGINFIRRSMRTVTTQEFKQMFPMSNPNPMYNYLIKNIDRVRVVDRGKVSRKTRQLPGYEHTDILETDFVNDAPYGFADVIMMFFYSVQTNRVLFKFDSSAINSRYQKDVCGKVVQLYPEAYINTLTYEEGLKAFSVLKPMIDQCPYLLIYKSRVDGVVVSHKKYRGLFGTVHDEVTSPCLGANIIKNDGKMNKLQEWISEGGKINPNNFYLIHKQRDSEQLYLARWKEATIPNEYSLLQF